MNLWNLAESCAVQSFLVMGLALMFALLLKKGSAAARHIVWALAFAVVLLLPVFSSIRPKASAPVVSDQLFPKVTWIASPVHPTARSLPSPSDLPGNPYENVPNLILLAWLAISLCLVAQLALDLWRLRQVAKSTARFRGVESSSFPGSFGRAMEGTRLLTAVTHEIQVPVTWGIFRPVIVVPSWSLRWSHERFEAVILHELAHISRRDFPIYLGARLACALFWFNPIAWLGLSRLRSEAETAADDQVLASGASPSGYAEHLYGIARDLSVAGRAQRNVGFAALREKDLERRIRDILGAKTRRFRAGALESLVVTLFIPILWLLPTVTPAEVVKRLPESPMILVASAKQNTPLSPPPERISQPVADPIVPIEQSDERVNNPNPSLPQYDSGQLQTPSPSDNDRTSPETNEPSLPATTTTSKTPSGLINLSFEDADVRQALRELFRQTGQSYTIAPDVQGTVTMELHNVSPELALANICRSADSTFSIQGGVYMIVHAERRPS